jgi:imidazolonepropionase-like amidohydrolase
MGSRILAGCCIALACSTASAQVPLGDLYSPPPGARHLVIESTGGKHGDSWSWVAADGTRMARESLNVRGLISDTDSSATAGHDGLPVAVTIRGFNPSGDVGETFRVAGGTAAWHSPVDDGKTRQFGRAFYLAQGGPMDLTAWLVERLLASPGRALDLLPQGRVHAERLTSLVVGENTPARQTVTLWSITGLNSTPLPVWADASNHFFAITQDLGWLPEAYAGEQQRLEVAQAAAVAARTAKLAHKFVSAPKAAVAFVHVRLFDADGQRFLEDQTVVTDKGLISASGPAAEARLPPQVRVIDGRGKTLVPGMWDCHMHVGDDYTGVQELSMGITSVRDPGNNDLLTLDRRRRTAAGDLLFPHVYPSSLIDGKGPYTAQVANVATSEAEAIRLVDRARDNAFTGIKFYGTFNPAWLPAAIAEAHRLGLHVHGHIPAGIRPLDAIHDGYDEVTHINWIIMQAMPDSVIAVSNSSMRFEGPGRFGKDVDLDGPAMTSIIATMAASHIYSDPTMSIFEQGYTQGNGELGPAYAAFAGILPPAEERGLRTGGFKVPADLTRADYRASWAKMLALLGRMHNAGIPIVAGTDGSGIEIIHELEIYVQAGFTPAEALAAATIVPARLTGTDTHTGSLSPGKNADLVLIDGDPSQHIGDLRHTRVVMLDGRLLDADALRSAAGLSGRPL